MRRSIDPSPNGLREPPESVARRHFLKAGFAGAASFLACRAGGAVQSPAAESAGLNLTMLNGMAGADFAIAAQRHVDLGLKWLDLKDALWGQTINDVSLENAERIARIAAAHRLGVFSLSTALCGSNIEHGEAPFRKRHFATLDHVLKVAGVLRPRCIRLLSAGVDPFPEREPVMAYAERRHPWLFDVYREMVDRIVGSGHRCLIENESTLFNRVDGVQRFFELLRRPGRADFTWDVQNFWEAGVFPTLDVYRQLKPLMGCMHLKGGRSEDGRTLAWASALEDASWPVADIVRAVVADGVAPVICLNPSHGKRPPGYDDWAVVQRDIGFLRKAVGNDARS